ncbi:MAG TPA: hypothetical protein PLH61_11165 [Bacteroidia bacterium]|nr:hypothetical protein [Bacteroidia bacterium]
MKKKSKNKNKKHQLPLISRLLILLIGTITIISMMMMPAMQQNSGEAKRVMVQGK